MKAVRCPNGHWFDSETYDKCPHCGETIEKNEPQASVTNPEKNKKGGFASIFKKSKSKESEQQKTKNDIHITTNEQTNKSQTSNTADEVTERFFSDIDDEKTVSMFEKSDNDSSQSKVIPPSLVVADEKNSINKSTSEPLSDAVQRVSAMEEGKTLSFFNAMTTQKDESDDAHEEIKMAEPVVGWLVCIAGSHKGESFQLFVGKNTIGRSDTNKVILKYERSISRENHATIIYEPKKREFYLQTGKTDGLIYLNDNFVDGTQIIKVKDVLEMGTLKFVFIPFCGEDFSWEQYI